MRSLAIIDAPLTKRLAARSVPLLGAVILAGCGFGSAPPPSATTSPSPTETSSGGSVVQDLTFTGKLPARWTTATAACGPADGKGADSFSVKLTAADALGQMDTLTIVVASGYKGVGEYSVDTTAVLSSAPPGNVQIATSAPELVTNFFVLVDKTSGTIDSTMGQGANPLDAIERVDGTWRCR